MSGGEWVSLGYFEKEDLDLVVAHLRGAGTVSTIALWGRSMGAVTALLHGDRDPSIAAMILDSPFADLTQLAEELVDKGRQQGLFLPGFVVSIAIRMIRSSVQKQAGFSISRLSPIKHVDKCFIPALFVCGEGDDFIAPHHSKQLYEKYAGDKNMVTVDGEHNTIRPPFFLDSASIFLQTCLQIPQEATLECHNVHNYGMPPWQAHSAYPFSMGGEMAHGMTRARQLETEQALFSALSGGTSRGGGGGQAWSCPTCTFQNPGELPFCDACGASRPLDSS